MSTLNASGGEPLVGLTMSLAKPLDHVSILCSPIIGVLAHLGFYMHGEWHLYPRSILAWHLAGFILLVLAGASSGNLHGRDLFQRVLLISVGHVTGLFASILTYRLFFHRLQKFPGPVQARISKLWHVWKCRYSKNHVLLTDLHKKYGNFVRTGPSEITVFHADVFKVVDGPKSLCIKADWYDILYPQLALITARSKQAHAARREQWSHGFTARALANYGERVLSHTKLLSERIRASCIDGHATDFSQLTFWYSFDIMGDLMFNKSFNMLRDRTWQDMVYQLHAALWLLGPSSPAPWVVQLAFRLFPRIGPLKDWFNMLGKAEAMIFERVNKQGTAPLAPDVGYYMIEKYIKNGFQAEDRIWLTGDAVLALVAGSEPTASTLINAFNELARNPCHAEKIYQELQGVDIDDIPALTRLPHLNAVISETMRLHPVVPTGGNRRTDAEPIKIGGTTIPPYTNIVAPRFVISRKEECFEKADCFIPERWYSRPDMVHQPNAYTPYGTGTHSCLGRYLANNIMYLVIARLVSTYRFRLPDGDDGSSVFEEMTDRFISRPGTLRLIFEPRKQA